MQTVQQTYRAVDCACDFLNVSLWNSEIQGGRGTRIDIIKTGLHLTEGHSGYVIKVN